MTRPRLSAQAVADLVGGRLFGNGEAPLEELASLESAGPASLAFLVSPRYLGALGHTRAGAILVVESLAGSVPSGLPRIVVDDPAAALTLVAGVFRPEAKAEEGIHPSVRLGVNVEIGDGVTIGPFVVIEPDARIGARTRIEPGAVIGAGVVIGADCMIGPHAVCYAGARLGDRVRLKAGAVIGGTGFGFLPGAGGHQRRTMSR